VVACSSKRVAPWKAIRRTNAVVEEALSHRPDPTGPSGCDDLDCREDIQIILANCVLRQHACVFGLVVSYRMRGEMLQEQRWPGDIVS
jgi:hypothetical protein